MAQPPGFNENSKSNVGSGEENIRREMVARGKRITLLQRECERLKEELEKYRVKLNRLRGQVMSGDIHLGRNNLKANQFDSYDHANLEIIGKFCKTQLFPHHKFLHSSWTKYSPDDETSLYHKCREEIELPSIEDEEFYWRNKTVPLSTKSIARSAQTSTPILRESILVSQRRDATKIWT